MECGSLLTQKLFNRQHSFLASSLHALHLSALNHLRLSIGPSEREYETKKSTFFSCIRVVVVSEFDFGAWKSCNGLPSFSLLLERLSGAQRQTIALNVLYHGDGGGWKLLFDGKTTSGWRGFRKSGFPTECWATADGILKRVKQKDPDGEECGDIVTAQQYDNFEFQLDWKIEPGGNSGIKYLVVEDRPANWEQAYLDYHLQSLKKSGKTEPAERLKPERWKYMSMSFELKAIDDTQNADARSSPESYYRGSSTT